MGCVYRYMDDMMGNLFSKVLFNIAHGFEQVCEIISDLRGWKPRKKFSRSYLQRKKRQMETKTALDYLRMPKLQEIFTTVAIMCHL